MGQSILSCGGGAADGHAIGVWRRNARYPCAPKSRPQTYYYGYPV